MDVHSVDVREERWPMVHKALGNIACEKHQMWSEDACVECDLDAEFEARKLEEARGTGRMIYKFVGRKSEWVKELEKMSLAQRHAFLENLPF